MHRDLVRPARGPAAVGALVLCAACAASQPGPTTAPPPATRTSSATKPAATAPLPLPEEVHLADLRQVTFGGENAEAYWAWTRHELIYQARPADQACDRIYRIDPFAAGAAPIPVSSGQGATTCSFFLPGDEAVIYASTHLASPDCPPRPDQSQGYVWALHPGYDIFRAKTDGSDPVRLTDTPGYDAEGTVCGKDGSIVFTSVRDGDLDLYRMDADGKNVRRLTDTPGYDGGAFFSPDCSKIVWRASRPKPGPELDEYRRLLKEGLVRPTQLELYVANADGSDPVQLTYLDAASFAPFWHPSGRRILFSSNYGDPKGREFDLWAIDVDGTHLERITYAPGFDGFPMFSPDGQFLAFSSNRATAKGQHDTNVFVARWRDRAPEREPPTAQEERGSAAADRVMADVAWLADPAREGRGAGTEGLARAGAWIEERMKALGLDPAGSEGFRQPFSVTTSVASGPATRLMLEGKTVPAIPLGFSKSGGEVSGEMVLAGYGIRAVDLGVDDYRGVDVHGRIALVRRFVPDLPAMKSADAERRYGDLRYKAWAAREHGAKALVVVDWPEKPARAPKGWHPPEEARLPHPRPEDGADAGLPVLVTTRDAIGPALMAKLQRKAAVKASLAVELVRRQQQTWNVVGRIAAGAPRLPGAVVLGAHYDHLGYGGAFSLAPDKTEPHLGADDNASGVAALLEAARTLAGHRSELRRDILVVAFSGEELGVLGSTEFTANPPPGVAIPDLVAMINMDMVGRMRRNHLDVLGAGSAKEWPELVAPLCAEARIECTAGGDGYGPSDQTPFYAAGVPVVHLFTGAHADYHKPSDAAAGINAAGLARVAGVAAGLARSVASREAHLNLLAVAAPTPRGDLRSFNASLGTIPDYTPAQGRPGMRISGVRSGGAAEQAGIKGGDLLIRLGRHAIGSVEDLMFVLNASKPGETVTAVVLREGKELSFSVTFQEGRR
jgi:hypothetical protein